MKYGRLIYRYTGKTYENNTAIYNIGDNVQTFAIDNIYKRMGISADDIVNINVTDMANYDGEYVILPVACYGSHYKRFSQLPASDKIIPLFVSFEMSDVNCDDIVPYLMKNAPIGCRDERTMMLLRSKGIEAYLSGCLTITLPRRTESPCNGKVFLVDVSAKLEKYIPDSIRSKCEYVKQEGEIGHYPMTEEDRIAIDEHAKKIFARYEKEAELVVTSRLHAAVPCIAMGIPVILALDNIDGRFSWLDKLIPLYDSLHYNEIDWNPHPVNIEDLKEKCIANVINRLKTLYEQKSGIYEISSYWEDRERIEYDAVLKKKLEAFRIEYEKNTHIKYVIWGAGVHGKLVWSMVKNEFPEAELIAVADNYMSGDMFGVPIVKPEKIKMIDFEYAFITTHLGRFEAVQILESLGKEKNREWCYFISKDVPEDQER